MLSRHRVSILSNVDLHRWTPVRDGGMGCRQCTPSSHSTTLESNKSVVQIDKNTVCDWLNRAALPCRSVALYFWGHLPVTECQWDELWGFVHTKEAHLPCAKLYCETSGDAWVWLAFAPVWRVGLAFVVGKRP